MKLAVSGIVEKIQRHYDRVIAALAMLGLLVTLLLLFVQIGIIRQRQVVFEGWMRGLRPAREHVDKVQETPFLMVQQALERPMQLVAGEQRERWFFVPESRFSCAECGHPVPVDADNCPFCGAAVTPPVIEKVDHDEDGMPSWWETEHGLDPNDAADAHQDRDGDGFTNLEEYLFDTDPNDPKSHPPLIDWLIVDKIEGQRFGLQFRSRVRTASGYRFGINYRLPNGDIKTDFVELGESVTGFTLESYEEKMIPAPPPQLGNLDRSELTIISPRGDRIILVKDEPVMHVEQTAHLHMGRTAPAHEFKVRRDEKFTLGGVEYVVIAVDAAIRHVVLERVSDQTRYTVTPEIRPRETERHVVPAAEAPLEHAAEEVEEQDPFIEMMR